MQRPLVWNLDQKRELIWSVLYQRNIPDLSIINRYPDESVGGNEMIEVIDGKQRLHTFFSFLDNEFTIEIDGVEYYFNDLPREYQTEIENYGVCYTEVLEHTKKIPDSFKIAWFKQINFAGTPQDREHMNSLTI